jgi:hypothetical protein
VNYQSEIERKIQLEDVRSGILTVVKRKNLLTLISDDDDDDLAFTATEMSVHFERNTHYCYAAPLRKAACPTTAAMRPSCSTNSSTAAASTGMCKTALSLTPPPRNGSDCSRNSARA